MNKFLALLALLGASCFGFAQTNDSLIYEMRSYMIPMRDGVKLNTVVIKSRASKR